MYSHFIAASQGPNFRQFFSNFWLLCAVILTCFPVVLETQEEEDNPQTITMDH